MSSSPSEGSDGFGIDGVNNGEGDCDHCDHISLTKLCLRVIAKNLIDFHPSNFVTLPLTMINELIDMAVKQHAANKLEERRSMKLIKPMIKPSLVLEWEKHFGDLSESTDRFWRCLCDDRFPSRDRPEIFQTTFTEVCAEVEKDIARLREILGTSSSCEKKELVERQRELVQILVRSRGLPACSKFLSTTKYGKVLQKVVKMGPSSEFVTDHALDLAKGRLQDWKEFAAMELEEDHQAEQPRAKTGRRRKLEESIQFCECTTHRKMYHILEGMRVELRSHQKKMKEHREKLDGTKMKEVTTTTTKKRKKMDEMLMGRVERDKLKERLMRADQKTVAGSTMKKLWKQTHDKAARCSNSKAAPSSTATTHFRGKNPLNNKRHPMLSGVPRNSSDRILTFPSTKKREKMIKAVKNKFKQT